MEQGFLFMETMRAYPVAECGEPLESLPDATAEAGVEVLFSTAPIAVTLERIHRLRRGLVPHFIDVARAMNDRGWVLKVEDGFRTRAIQKWLGRMPGVFDTILRWTVAELHGRLPEADFLQRRVSSMVATRAKVGTHMSGSAIDISVWRRDDGGEVERDGFYPEMSERTPMASPYASETARANRAAITQLMVRHGFIAYPFEFWHYSQGDAYAEHLTGSGRPARYGPVDWNPADGSVTPVADPDEPLNSIVEIEAEIARALTRAG
jgi:D-alanyl-D-alanine dipeptidase